MEVQKWIEQLQNPEDEFVYKASDRLADCDEEGVVPLLIELLEYNNLETRYLAARTLSLMNQNDEALEALFEAIYNKENTSIQGDLVMTLEGFDLSNSYVEIFKLYLFGSFKVSKSAKALLDYEEFDITARVLKKAKKHWSHYLNNIKQDDAFELRKMEVEEMLDELEEFLHMEE